MAVIRNVRGGTVGWNEDDRLKMASLLIKAGYTVKIAHIPVDGDPKKKKEYVIEYVDDNEKKSSRSLSGGGKTASRTDEFGTGLS